MKRFITAAVVAVLFILPFSASAAGIFTSTDTRAAAVENEVAGNYTYEACLARKFVAFAEEELSQHDMDAAHAFMQMAEEAAAKAGGAK